MEDELEEDDDFMEALFDAMREELRREKILFPNITKLKKAEDVINKLQKLFDTLDVNYKIDTRRIEISPCDVEIEILIDYFDLGLSKIDIISFIKILDETDFLSVSMRIDNKIHFSFRISDVFIELEYEKIDSL